MHICVLRAGWGVLFVGLALAATPARTEQRPNVAPLQPPVKPQGVTPTVKPPLKSGTSGPSGPSGPPYTLTAPQLTVTGTGALSAAVVFAPVSFTAPSLTVTGTGALATVAAFPPVEITAPALSVTGTGTLR